MNTAILLLGSNIEDRSNYLRLSLEALSEIGNIKIKSAVYESESWGFLSNTNFYNQVIVIETEYSSSDLLYKLQKIESELGRKRQGPEYISRTIDLDILFFNDDIIESNNLIIPHQQIQNRRFTLLPLNEILPEYIHPKLKISIKKLLDLCQDQGNVWKI